MKNKMSALKRALLCCICSGMAFNGAFAQDVNVSIEINNGNKQVSPYIYGKNNTTSGKVDNPLTEAQWTQVRESGATILRENYGNESTKYNWKRKLTCSPDWYNAISDYDWDFEAKSILDNLPNVQAMFGFQMLGYAAKSKDHNWPAWTYHVENNTPWPPCSPHQNLAGGGEPNMSDPNSSKAAVEGDYRLYLEEWPIATSVQILDHWFGSGGLGFDKDKFRYWALDNEPELWSSTHDDVQKGNMSPDDFMKRYFEAAKLARSKYPNIKLVGPVTSGEWFWYNWPGGGTLIDGKKVCWLEYFIKRVADEQKATGIRLLDVLTIHFYPGEKTDEEIVQTHRVFFDENYVYPGANGVFAVNGGWDTSIKNEYVFKRCNDWLNKYMGTGHNVTLGVTECGIKSENPNTAAVWYASTLGEFMKYGVELFTPWTWRKGMWETLHLFARYNESTLVKSVSSDETYVSAYTTRNSAKDKLAVVLVNRSSSQTKTVNLNPSDFTLNNEPFQVLTLKDLPTTETFVSHAQNALRSSSVSKSRNSVKITLAPMSISTVILKGKPQNATALSYQAENYTSQSGTTTSSANSGYTGSGYVDYGGDGSWMEWNNINTGSSGEAELTLRYANGSAANRQCQLVVNGSSVGSLTFSPSGGWTSWGTQKIKASLRSGNNTIRIVANTSSGGPNLDKMDMAMISNVPIGKTIWIKANANQNYVSADINMSTHAPLVANRTKIGSWEKFDVIDAGGGYIALRAVSNGNYVCADKNIAANAPLNANRTKIGSWEKFQWVDAGNGFFALKANATGKYVCANKSISSNAPLVADVSVINSWEQFTYGQTTKSAEKGDHYSFENQSLYFTVYPNPCQGGSINLSLYLDSKKDVKVTVADYLGRTVLTKQYQNIEAGPNELNIDLGIINKGIYFIRVQAGDDLSCSKLIVN
jgi:hypothetical protein